MESLLSSSFDGLGHRLLKPPGMSFRDLKANRASRQSASSYIVNSSEATRGLQTKSNDDLYSQLDTSKLSIRQDLKHGRGIWSQCDIKPGSTILSIEPHVYSISTKHLNQNCSYCIKETNIQRCTSCLVIGYCSRACQMADWSLHKHECKAIKRWKDASPQDARSLPPDGVRAIGRLIWARMKHGEQSVWWREIEEMQSHEQNLSDSQQESFAHFGHSLAIFLGSLPAHGIHSAKELVRLLSKFTTNSFTLSSPSLTALGVAISPLPALINHSCSPNCSVVFPKVVVAQPPQLQVISIGQIKSGQEILAAYVDITLPRTDRRTALLETYRFSCSCFACSDEEKGSEKAAFLCAACGKGLIPYGTENIAPCGTCGETAAKNSDRAEAIRLALNGLRLAEKTTDTSQAVQSVSKFIALLFTITPQVSHPRLALMRLKHSLLTSALVSDNSVIDEAIMNSVQVVSALKEVLPHGHPIRGVATTELGKLLCVDEPEANVSDQHSFPPRGHHRLLFARKMLLEAKDEVEIGFGEGGGDIGDEVRKLLIDIEKELSVFGQVRNAINQSTSTQI